MANGDIAVAEAGFVAVKSTDDFRLGYDRINESADLAVRRGIRNFSTVAAMNAVPGLFLGALATVAGSTYRWNSVSGTGKWVLWERGPIAGPDLWDLPSDVGYWNDQGISEGNVVGGMLYINLATYSNNAQNFGTTFATLKAGYRPFASFAWGAGQALSGIDANAEAVVSYIVSSDGTIKAGRAGNAAGSIGRANAHRLSAFFRLAQ